MNVVRGTLSSAAVHSARWRQSLLVLLALLALVLIAYWPTASAMAAIWWRSETYTHGALVPVVSLWLIWRQRERLLGLMPQPSILGVLALMPAGLMWLAGDLVAVNAATQFALVASIALLVPAVLGWRITREIAFAIAFLFFAVPIGDFLMPQLMVWTADFTVAALRLSGIPVYREGLQFVIPSGTWSVVEACSGIRYLIASLTVGSLYAYLSYRSTRKRVAFVFVSIAVPIVANWLRAYMIVMLGHLSGNKIATGVDHLVYGWVFFGVVIFLMFMVGSHWADATSDEPVESATSVTGNAVAAATPARMASLAVLAALCLLVPVGIRDLLDGQRNARAPVLKMLGGHNGWATASGALAPWSPAYAEPRARQISGFARDGAIVGVQILYYRNQDYVSKLVSSENVVLRANDSQWNRSATAPIDIPWGSADRRILGSESVLLPLVNRSLGPTSDQPAGVRVWQLYWVDGQWTSSAVAAKLLGAWQRLRGGGDDGAAVFIYANLTDGSRQAMTDFARSYGEHIEQVLIETRKGP